jgi:hypothetical protein
MFISTGPLDFIANTMTGKRVAAIRWLTNELNYEEAEYRMRQTMHVLIRSNSLRSGTMNVAELEHALASGFTACRALLAEQLHIYMFETAPGKYRFAE